jgi:hypothetical protein
MNLRHPGIAIPLAAVASLLAAAGIIRSLRPGPIPDRAEAVGRFEIVTQFKRDESRMDEDSVKERYSVRWRGEEVTFSGAAGMFGYWPATHRTVNAVITFPTPQPAFVVNVGDPRDRSFFFLVREVGGRAKAEPLGPDSAAATADWIDPPRGDTVTWRDRAVGRRHLAGGTLLLLGDSTVLDTRTLHSYQFRRHEGAHPSRFGLPNALSPDRRSFARVAVDSAYAPLLLVNRFAAGESYVLPIDRRVMRYNDFEDIDRRWVEHHFQWRSVDGGPERLVLREGVAPLPYRVRRFPGNKGNNPWFMVLPAKREMKDTLISFLRREMDAVLLDSVPVAPDASGWTPPTSLRIGEERVDVAFLAEDSPGGSPRVVVTATLGRPSRITVGIADRFDAELRTGRHDALFIP